MMVSTIVAIVIVAAVVYWLIRSSQNQTHHLDGLHITPKS